MTDRRDTLIALKRRLAQLGQTDAAGATQLFRLGVPAVDEPLGGGLARAVLHEVFARSPANGAAASGFGLGLAMLAAGSRPIVWIRQDFAETEAGRLYAPGLVELGRDPSGFILVRARDASGVLRAAMEAVRCQAVGAVGLEPWGEPGVLDLTATRRLSLAASASGVTALLVRAAARPEPSSAATRWSVASAPSRPLPANAPGFPSFAVSLLRHRAGLPARDWHVEWNRDRCSFQDGTSLSRAVVSVSADRPDQVGRPAGRDAGFRRAG